MVRAQRRLLDVLGIDRLLAVGGGSLGGMQALEWTVAYPDQVRACMSIASTAHLGAQGMAWNAIARNAIMADPDWQGGSLLRHGPRADGRHRRGAHGRPRDLSVRRIDGRQVRSPPAGPPRPVVFTWPKPTSKSKAICAIRRSTFANRFDANSYLYISRALTYFDLARDHGDGSLERALAEVAGALPADFLLVRLAVSAARLDRDSKRALQRERQDVEHHLIQASYGHDSFLLEEARQAPLIAAFLDNVYTHG